MRSRSLCDLALIFCAISAPGQSQTIGPNGEGSFIAGPEGVPVMVLNEANSWSQPLVVYKNRDIELIIPDIRTAGWAASYASAFKTEGTYFTYLYIYGVQSHHSIRETLYVNTRTKIAVVIENAFTPPSRVDLCKPDPLLPIDRITAIVKNVSDSFHGQSLDDAIAEQSYTVAKMIACSDSPASQDCTMSDAEYRATHPRYPRARTPTEILLAQIAPMTARQPKEACKGVPTDEGPASSPTAPAPVTGRPATSASPASPTLDSILNAINAEDSTPENKLKPYPVDADLERDVAHALSTYPVLKSAAITPISLHREVTLSGTVPNESCRELAELIAKYVPGVTEVHNNLTIIPQETGNRFGPESGDNSDGGYHQVGGRISAPEVIHSVEAQFSDEARRAKYQGVCLISLIVDVQGNPQNIRVARSLGKGLDEKAIEAVRQYKFRPAMKDGETPVPVMITIEVNFRLY